MVGSYKGVMIECDESVKVIIQEFNSRNGGKVVVFDLDETHLIITPDSLAGLRAFVEETLEANTYNLSATTMN